MSTINTLKKVAAIIISTEKESKKSIQGSGTLIQSSDKYYVLTAEHCINGRIDDRLKNICSNDISVRVNEKLLKVVSILKTDEIKDFAVLEVEKVEYNLPSMIYSSDIEEPLYTICGYPNIREGTARLFDDCKEVSNDIDTFTLNCKDFQMDSSGNGVIKNVYGLSGSGVFIKKGKNTLVLKGFITKTWDEEVSLGDLICNDISFLPEIIPLLELSSFSTSNEIIIAKQTFEDKTSKETIENWKLENNDGFENIERKCSLVYPRNKLNRRIFNYVKQHLLGVALIDKVYIDAPEHHQEIIEYINEFELEVENDYSKEIASKAEGLSIIKSIKDDLGEVLKDFDFIARKNVTTLKNYTIAEYLRECSLDFQD